MSLAGLRRSTARISTTPGDAALALVFLILGQLDAWFGSEWIGSSLGNAALMAVCSIALAWRRRWPIGTLAVVVGGLVVDSIFIGASESPVSLLIVLVAAYSAAAHARSIVIPILLLVIGIGVHDSLDPQIKTVGDALYDSTIVTLVFLVGLSTRWRQRRLEAKETEYDQRVVEHEALAAEEREDERRRIARELHDIVSHSLGIVVVQAGAAEQMLERDPDQARVAIQSVRSTALEAINEMSRLLGLIRGEVDATREPQPSLSQVPALAQRMRDAGLHVELVVTGSPVSMSAAVELSAYRIVQEAMTNVLKHAPDSTARVELEYADDELRVSVSNDAQSDRSDKSEQLVGGRGLVGLRERVAVFGGRLEAGPATGGAWQLQAALPYS